MIQFKNSSSIIINLDFFWKQYFSILLIHFYFLYIKYILYFQNNLLIIILSLEKSLNWLLKIQMIASNLKKKYRCILEQQRSSLTGKRETKKKRKKRKSLSPVKPPRRVKKLSKPMERPRAESSRAYRGVFRHIIDTGLITFLGEMSGQRSDIMLPYDLPLDFCRANPRLVRAIIWHSAFGSLPSIPLKRPSSSSEWRIS